MKILHTANIINIVMYVYPILYETSDILSAVTYDKKSRKYKTDINPSRIINGPLSGPGEELESPLKDEWLAFIEDCKFIVKEVGFTIIDDSISDESGKSEYILTYGINETPCGSIAYDIQISDHPLDAKFPDEAKDTVLKYFIEHDVLDENASKDGIDFQVEKVMVGGVKEDSWNRALNRLYNVLKRMKTKVE